MSELVQFNEDSDPLEIANGGTVVSSEEWTQIPDGVWFQTCCDCGLTHYAMVRQGEAGMEVRHIRRDDITAAHRALKDVAP